MFLMHVLGAALYGRPDVSSLPTVGTCSGASPGPGFRLPDEVCLRDVRRFDLQLEEVTPRSIYLSSIAPLRHRREG
jgi:hypothetical protein